MAEPRPAGAVPGGTWLLVAFTAALAAGSWETLAHWYAVSRASDDASHLVLMPLVAGVLLYLHRRRIFERAGRDRRFIPVLLVSMAALLAGTWAPLTTWQASDQASLRVALFVATWVAGFGLVYGASAMRRGMFPLAMLLLMVPIPTWLLQQVIYFLQWGSAEGTALLFSLTNTPVYRDGFTFLLPGIAIEVAEECSGIRSSMALLITGLLASHLYLHSNVSKVLLVLAVVPLAIVKNSIRIVTLTYLAVHVDPGFLEGDLHRRGGTLFFLITLAMLGGLLWALRRLENRKTRRATPTSAAQAPAR